MSPYENLKSLIFQYLNLYMDLVGEARSSANAEPVVKSAQKTKQIVDLLCQALEGHAK